MARELYSLVASTMHEAEKAYANGNEAEYIRLETNAKETLFYGLDRGLVTYKDALAIADACMIVL